MLHDSSSEAQHKSHALLVGHAKPKVKINIQLAKGAFVFGLLVINWTEAKVNVQ